MSFKFNLRTLKEELALSFRMYGGKNSLIVVNSASQGPRLPPHYSSLSRFGVNAISLEAINIQYRTRSKPNSSPKGTDTSDQYSDPEIEAAKRIQKFWRLWIPRLRALRSFRDTPRGRVVQLFTELTNTHCVTLEHKLETQDTLLTEGVELYLGLVHLKDRVAASQTRAMRCFDDVNIATSRLETLDDIISDISDVSEVSNHAVTAMSEALLVEVLKSGCVQTLQLHLTELKRMTENTEEQVAGIEKRLSIHFGG